MQSSLENLKSLFHYAKENYFNTKNTTDNRQHDSNHEETGNPTMEEGISQDPVTKHTTVAETSEMNPFKPMLYSGRFSRNPSNNEGAQREYSSPSMDIEFGIGLDIVECDVSSFPDIPWTTDF